MDGTYKGRGGVMDYSETAVSQQGGSTFQEVCVCQHSLEADRRQEEEMADSHALESPRVDPLLDRVVRV